MLYVIHVVRRTYIRCPRCFVCADGFGVGKVTRKQLSYSVQCRRLTSRMMARAGAGGNCVVFPEDQRKAEVRKLPHLKRTCTSKAFHSQEIMCSR